MKDIIALLFLIIIASSCSDLQQKLDVKDFYPHDIEVTVNKIKYAGVGTLPYQPQYDFDIKAPGKLDLLMYSTCHRANYKEEGWEDSWLSSKNEGKFSYRPSDDMERHSCPIIIAGYEKIKGRHATAFLDFQDSLNKMPVALICNGNVSNHIGVGVCQSMAGLTQKIKFPVKMLAESAVGCPKPKEDGTDFLINLGRGYCVYNFLAQAKEDNRTYRLTTYGYDEPVLRKD